MGCAVCTKRGEPKNQTLLIILLPGVDIIEIGSEGKEIIVVENSHGIHREEGEEVSTEEDSKNLMWEENCLLRFDKFL